MKRFQLKAVLIVTGVVTIAFNPYQMHHKSVNLTRNQPQKTLQVDLKRLFRQRPQKLRLHHLEPLKLSR